METGPQLEVSSDISIGEAVDQTRKLAAILIYKASGLCTIPQPLLRTTCTTCNKTKEPGGPFYQNIYNW